jgi:hypothetical protein
MRHSDLVATRRFAKLQRRRARETPTLSPARRAKRQVASAIALLLLAIPAHAQRNVEVGDDDALRAALRGARPGDTIQIAPGVYRGGILVEHMRGAEGKPITITAADRENPPIIRGGNTGMQLVNPAHVEVSHLVIEGARYNGLNIDDGGSMNATARQVRIDSVVVRDIGPQGNRDGIKLSGVSHFTVVNCSIERWGDGGSGIDMVGCHHGTIERTTLRHGDTVGSTGIQAKGGTTEVRILDCRFEHAGRRAINIGGSTGDAFFRPPLAPRDNAEARHVRIERCVFIGSEAPIAFTTSVHCSVTDNTFYRPTRWVMRLLQEKPLDRFVSSGDHTFAGNTIIWRRGDLHAFINVGPDTRPQSMTFESNTWYCEDAPGQSVPTLPVLEINGIHGTRPPDETLERVQHRARNN